MQCPHNGLGEKKSKEREWMEERLGGIMKKMPIESKEERV